MNTEAKPQKDELETGVERKETPVPEHDRGRGRLSHWWAARWPAIGHWWQEWRILFRFLRPTTLQLVAAILPGIVYIFNDQAAEILSMLAEAMLPGPHRHFLAPVLFVLGSATGALAIWWTTRMMLELRWDPPIPPSHGAFARWRARLQRSWPRFLGLLPVLLIAVAFFVRATTYRNAGGETPRLAVIGLGAAHLLVAVVLEKFFRARRARMSPSTEAKFANFAALNRASLGSRSWNGFLLAISGVTLLSLWLAPQVVAPFLGTGAMLSLAAVAWVTVGTRLMEWRVRTGVPLFSLLLGWVLLNSWWMDNHRVRLSRQQRPLSAGPSVAKALDTWLGARPANVAEKNVRPLFLVATEGGGIRAAFWTATVLGVLEEESRQQAVDDPSAFRSGRTFAGHCFAISGVSGGSVGAAVFAALLADGRSELETEAQSILGTDHLAPLMGAFLFPDALQRVLPWPCPASDRGAVLERSWERAYRHTTGGRRLSEPFHDLWKSDTAASAAPVPHLIFNATIVNTGQRVLFTDFAVAAPAEQREFHDAVDMREVLFQDDKGKTQSWDVPLSTAAHASARFTYTNPAGLLSSGQRVVDGGYFENSGAASLREVLAAIRQQLEKRHMTTQVVPVVIIVSNDPQRQKEGTRATWQNAQQAKLRARLMGSAAAKEENPSKNESGTPTDRTAEFKSTKPEQFCSELLSPIRALLHTREARGSLALQTLFREEGEHVVIPNSSGVQELPTIIRFHLIDDGIPLPLGWSLSQQAAEDMRGQTSNWENAQAIADVLAWLKLAN